MLLARHPFQARVPGAPAVLEEPQVSAAAADGRSPPTRLEDHHPVEPGGADPDCDERRRGSAARSSPWPSRARRRDDARSACTVWRRRRTRAFTCTIFARTWSTVSDVDRRRDRGRGAGSGEGLTVGDGVGGSASRWREGSGSGLAEGSADGSRWATRSGVGDGVASVVVWLADPLSAAVCAASIACSMGAVLAQVEPRPTQLVPRVAHTWRASSSPARGYSPEERAPRKGSS